MPNNIRPYRGKRKNGEWVYGWYSREYDDHIIQPNFEDGESDYMAYPIIPETVGQLIGINDKHGKGIYGGDIVKRETFLKKRPTGKVVWADDTCQFGLMEPNGYIVEMRSWESDEYEIIGNIHDNPELLEASNG